MEFPLKMEPLDGITLPHLLQEIKLENFQGEGSSLSQKIFECSLCDYTTNNKSNYKRHEQFKHKLHVPDPLNLQNYHCNSCDYTSNNKSNLNRHNVTVHKDILIKEETCEPSPTELIKSPCTPASSSSASVENSFSQVKSKTLWNSSTQLKKFNCNMCNYCTNDKGNFKRHQKSKHKLAMVETNDYNQNSAFKTEADPMKSD